MNKYRKIIPFNLWYHNNQFIVDNIIDKILEILYIHSNKYKLYIDEKGLRHSLINHIYWTSNSRFKYLITI